MKHLNVSGLFSPRSLGLLNALDKDRDIPEDLAQLFGEPCIKLAEGIKSYISKVSLSL